MERYLLNLLQSSLHIKQFKQVHALIVTNYPTLTPVFVQGLLRLSIIPYARQVFDRIPQPNHFLYNSLISTYSRLSLNKEALEAFVLMHDSGIRVVCSTISPVMKSCTSLLAIELANEVHSLVVKYGFSSDVFVQTPLMDFYAKTSDIDSAKKVFDEILVKDPICYNCLISGYSKSGDVIAGQRLFDEMTERTVVSWNSMISCYANNGYYHEGLRIFERMQAERFCPNETSVATVLSVCAKLRDLEMGLRVKKFIDENNFRMNMIVSTALLEMYVKCGAVDDARQEFNRMDRRDVVAWSAMIAGYAQNGRPIEALELFERMKSEQIKPNDVALVSVLSACSQLGSLEAGERIGYYVESQGFVLNVYVASALLDMYSKCGNISKAHQIFNKMPHKDVVSWNTMIVGLAANGFGVEAINLYEKMKEIGVKPNDITFVGILTACTHARLLELGLGFFRSMKSDHEITPTIEHYACVVDLFCRSGKLKDAYEFICRMEVEPNVVIWGTLLSSSRIHSNLELAELSVKKLLELEPENSGNYVLLSNIYASAGRWQEAVTVRNLMKTNRVQKITAYSWIEMDNKVHKFLVGDTSHPRSNDVYGIVDGLAMQLTWTGYNFDSDLEFG
jgi:pentatricopeptide repeat protein